MEFRVLGPVEAESLGRQVELGSTKQRALLALLILRANRPIGVDTLVEELWVDAAPPRAPATLHAYVSRLRRALEPTRRAGTRQSVLVTEPGGYVLRIGAEQLDAWRFERLAGAGREALAAGQASEAADLLQQSLALWRGPAYGEFAAAHFAMAEAARLEEARLAVDEDRYEAGLRLGQHVALVSELEHAVEANPLRERPVGQLMVALYRSGRQGEALAVYQSTRRALVDELGVEPGPDLRELEAAILRQEPELLLTTGEPAVVRPPSPEPRRPGGSWARPPLPPAATAGSRVPFVGRGPEFARLECARRESASGETRLVLVTGEPGIGKSRLAGRVAEVASRAGATVLWGRATEEAVITYQPFAEAFEPLTDAILGPLGPELGPVAPRLGRLLPGVAAQLPAPSFVAKPDVERYLLFEAARSLLGAVAGTGPVVLVLEDLHWADESSLALFDHLLRRPLPAAVLVLATYRDTDLHDEHPLRRLAADCSREPWADQVILSGLDHEGVAELIAASAGRVAPEGFARAVVQETDGNPFYVIEVVCHLADFGVGWETVSTFGEGAHVGLPTTVRTVIEQRLGRLSSRTQEALRAAAVIGRDFDVDLLGDVVGTGDEHLSTALEEAARARLIGSVATSPRGCTFSHALVRETAYQSIAAPRRLRLHRRIGEALESPDPAASDERAGELAYHFARASGVDSVEKAVRYGRRAAARAAARLAYEEAATRYDDLLTLLPRLGRPEPHLEAEVLLELGEARFRAGQRARSRDALAAATAAARRAGDPEILARVALGVSGWGVQDLWADYGVVATGTVGLLEEALAASPPDAGLRARLTARLAEELYFDDDESRRLDLSASAVEAARHLGDPALLASALHSRLRTMWAPDNLDERLAVCIKMLEAATAVGDAELAMTARGRRAANLLEQGALDEAGREIAAHHRLADDLHHPLHQVWSAGLRGGLHLLGGRFDQTEALMNEAAALAPEVFASVQAFAGQLCVLRIEQGRAEEMVDVAAQFVDEFPHVPAWRAGLAVLYAEAGRIEQARVIVDRLTSGLAQIRRDQNWLFCMGALAEVCAVAGSPAQARAVYDVLRPHAEQFVTLGDGYATWCSVEKSLGIAARTMGRADVATWHLARALRAHRALRARPLVARTEYEYALALLDRRESHEDARRHLRTALTSARSLGMTGLARHSERFLDDSTASGVA